MLRFLLSLASIFVVEVQLAPNPDDRQACHSQLPVPDPHDCSLFWICEGNIKQQIRCSPGTWFNPDIYVCDWPANVQCNARPPSNQDEITPTSSTLTTANPIETTTNAKQTSTGTSQRTTEQEEETETPTPESELEVETETLDPGNLETSESELATETIEDDTEEPEVTEEQSTTQSAEVPDETTLCPESPQPEDETEIAKSICQRYSDRIFFAPHPTYCQKYVFCHHGTAFVFDCPRNTYYGESCEDDPSVCNRPRSQWLDV